MRNKSDILIFKGLSESHSARMGGENMMKKIMRIKIMFVVAVAVVFSASMPVRADETHISSTAITPAATGMVNHSTDRNGNTEVILKVEQLARPQSLTPAKSHYIVWVQSSGAPATNVGELRVNDDLAGSLKFTTPYRSFQMRVTAEDSEMATQASSVEVLRGNVQAR